MNAVKKINNSGIGKVQLVAGLVWQAELNNLHEDNFQLLSPFVTRNRL